MSVAELIAALSQIDPDLPVIASDGATIPDDCPVREVHVRNGRSGRHEVWIEAY